MKQKFSFGILLGTLLLVPFLVFADLSPTLANPAPGVGSTLQDFVYLLITIIQWVALPLLVLSIIRAGYVLVSAGGNPEQISKGKLWVLWTLVGAAVILGARVIANIVFGTAALF